MTAKEYAVKHTGWLLACLSTNNIVKGKLALAKLSSTDAKAARFYRDECLARYAGK